MENKYQEALNHFKIFSDGYDDTGYPMFPYTYNTQYKKNVDTLQEAIDKLGLTEKMEENEK